MKRFSYLLIFIVLGAMPSCRFLYPNQMFKQKDYQYFDLAQKEIHTYVIQPGDALTLRVFTRDGFKLIDVLGGGVDGLLTAQTNATVSFTYLVDHEGVVKLPVLGYFIVKGYTETELERILAEKYAGLFVDPWVSVKVTNRKVFIFKESSAKIISLTETPISIIEVIASANGLENDAKAYKIKVVRGDIKNPQVYLVDLSTLEGIRKSDLTVQPNDIIIIERKRRVISDILRELGPYLGAVSTVSTIIILAKTLGNQ